jgi:fructose-specific phosphotransferase system IIA component
MAATRPLLDTLPGQLYCRSVMNIKKVLNKDLVSLNLPGATKREIIEAMVDLAMKSGKITDRQTALNAVLEREEKMSTGIQYGVAIPHGKCDAVKELVACIGLKPEGVDFASLDGEPSRIFIMTISPLNRTGPHVQFLAEISRILKDEKSREAMLAAGSVPELLALL